MSKLFIPKKNLKLNGYLGSQYIFSKSQYNESVNVYDFEYIIDHNNIPTTKIIEEKHTIIRDDICEWLEYLQENNSPFVIKKHKTGFIKYIRTQELPPKGWINTKVKRYKFLGNLCLTKSFTVNIFEYIPVLLEPQLFVSFLNKKDLSSFICTCREMNKRFHDFYKSRNWEKALKYNRFKYAIEFEKNDKSSRFKYQKNTKENQFTIKEQLKYAYGESVVCFLSPNMGFCDKDGNLFHHLFIDKQKI